MLSASGLRRRTRSRQPLPDHRLDRDPQLAGDPIARAAAFRFDGLSGGECEAFVRVNGLTACTMARDRFLTLSPNILLMLLKSQTIPSVRSGSDSSNRQSQLTAFHSFLTQ
jgi:hypothetical protein